MIHRTSFLIFFYLISLHTLFFSFFFFNDTATTEIYTLSLHDALPISAFAKPLTGSRGDFAQALNDEASLLRYFDEDRKSTRLNSSHSQISYAVFCLKKKKKNIDNI